MAKTIAEVVQESSTNPHPRTRMRSASRTQLALSGRAQQKRTRQRAFLLAYGRLGTVGAAAEKAGVGRETHYWWLEKDSTYAERFAQAEKAFADRLERAVMRRVIEGEKEYIPNPHTGVAYELDEQGKPDRSKPIMQRKFNAQRDIALLRAHRPEKYREDKKIELTGPGFSKPEINIVLVREVVSELKGLSLPQLPELSVIEGEAHEVQEEEQR